MSIRSHITVLFCCILALVVTGCGNSEGATPAKESRKAPAPKADPDALQTIVGRAVSASQTEVVIDTEDGKRAFTIAPEDVKSVDPGHIQSHVGIENLAFRIYYRAGDDSEQAVAAEEVDLQAEAVDQTQ